MSVRALNRVPGLALALGLVWAAVAGAGAGCASTERPPTLSDASGSSSGGSGSFSGNSGSASSGSDAGSSIPAPQVVGLAVFGGACAPGTPSVKWSPVRRVSRAEYDNMVRDLLQDTTQPAKAFVEESVLSFGVNFQANTYTSVSSLIGQQYMQTAETLAQNAASSQNTLNNVLGCSSQDDACAQTFIAHWANRAFRGQLDAAESASLLKLYQDVKAQFDFATGIQAVIAAVLESPRFLYVLEFGDGSASSGVVPLSPYEIAGRLAFFLWRTVPDDNLMKLAGSGQLGTAAQVMAQAQAMLSDPKALDATADFTTQWMQLEGTGLIAKDAQFKKWSAQTAEELKDEALTTYSQTAITENGTLTDVLTSPASYVSSDLANNFYGTSPGSGTPVTVNDSALDPSNRSYTKTTLSNKAGILTNSAVLATQSHTTLPSAILRGKLVREQVLCDVLPAPPPGIPSAPTAAPAPGGTTRDLLESHLLKGSSCVGCHQYMDPIGLGFGSFDATGAYQAADLNGTPSQDAPPVDAHGQVSPMSNGELSIPSFNGAADLATQLAASSQAQECFALQQFRYALSRIESSADACSVQQAFKAFSSDTLNIQKLMVALTGTDAFRYRSAGSAGSSCQ